MQIFLVHADAQTRQRLVSGLAMLQTGSHIVQQVIWL